MRRTIDLEEVLVGRLGSKLLGIGNGLLESGRHFDCWGVGWLVWLLVESFGLAKDSNVVVDR